MTIYASLVPLPVFPMGTYSMLYTLPRYSGLPKRRNPLALAIATIARQLEIETTRFLVVFDDWRQPAERANPHLSFSVAWSATFTLTKSCVVRLTSYLFALNPGVDKKLFYVPKIVGAKARK